MLGELLMGFAKSAACRKRSRALKALRRSIPILSLFALALFAGCGSDEDTEPTSSKLPEEITIGAAIAKTGYIAPYDANIAAIEQLVEETNANGGIDGHKVRIVQADNRSDPQQAAVAAQKVIEQGADVLLLSCEALTAAAAAPVAEENNELNFTMCANEPGFGPPTTGRLSFSGSPSLLSEASARATFLHDKGIERPFLLRDTSIVLGKTDCGAFQQSWEHLGGEIAGSADFKNEDESIASQISELKSSDAGAVMLCSYPPGGAAAIKQIRAAGIDLPIAASASFDGTFWLKGIPNLGDVYVTMNGSAYDPPDQETAKLFASLKRAGVNTDVSGALLASYAAGQLILAAIEETGSVDGEVLADALEAKPHPTIVGEVSYTRENHYPTRTWPVYVFSNGKPKFVTEVKPEFIPEYGG
jgi:branched-chain amino acid transport system substrate-binding protein